VLGMLDSTLSYKLLVLLCPNMTSPYSSTRRGLSLYISWFMLMILLLQAHLVLQLMLSYLISKKILL
jgi:hypothetical protein